MSKAFTREETDGPDIPELPPLASVLPAGAKNYITAKGAQSLRDELAHLVNRIRPPLAAATDDPDAKRQLVSTRSAHSSAGRKFAVSGSGSAA